MGFGGFGSKAAGLVFCAHLRCVCDPLMLLRIFPLAEKGKKRGRERQRDGDRDRDKEGIGD